MPFVNSTAPTWRASLPIAEEVRVHLQPGETFVHPVVGFQVSSVHSMRDTIISPPWETVRDPVRMAREAQWIEREYTKRRRQLMLGVLTRSGRELLDIAKSNPKTLALVSVMIDDYVKRTSQLIEELAKPARVRVMLALCDAEEMERIVAEAKAEYASTSQANRTDSQRKAAVQALRLVVDNTTQG